MLHVIYMLLPHIDYEAIVAPCVRVAVVGALFPINNNKGMCSGAHDFQSGLQLLHGFVFYERSHSRTGHVITLTNFPVLGQVTDCLH